MLHGQHIDLNGLCVMLHFSCGGAAGNLNTYRQAFQQITADRWGSRQGEICDQFIVLGPSNKEGLSKAENPFKLHVRVSECKL